MNDQKVCTKKTSRGCYPCAKGGNHKITSCPQALYNNHIDKIQKSQLCTTVDNFTLNIQSSQETKFEILNKY